MEWRAERDLARKTEKTTEFLKHPNVLVREGLLVNPNVKHDILCELSHDDSTNIREKLAHKFVESATRDPNWRVRYAAINNNPEVPSYILEELINDTDARVKAKAQELLEIQNDYIYRKDYNNGVTIKLIIPGDCNANCHFCYNKHCTKMETATATSKEEWLDSFLIPLEQIVMNIDEKQAVSIDITGNEPTLDANFFIKVMHKLRSFCLRNKIIRITCTTNGVNLKKVAPYMKGVVNYVNISVHDYRQEKRSSIFGTYHPTDEEYRERVQALLDNSIHSSAIAVIDREIEDFSTFRDEFIKWAEDIGFVSLRFRHNVYNDDSLFLNYMSEAISHEQFFTIQRDNVSDSNWCQLSTKSGFFVYFLEGVIDTYKVSPGIEFIVHDDGKLYADFDKTIPFEKYKFPVGYIFDKR